MAYGQGTEMLFAALSKHAQVKSVHGSGWTAVDGVATPNTNASGGFSNLIHQLADRSGDYDGDAIVMINEESGAIAEDIIAAMAGRSWRLVHANPSGSNVGLWFAKTACPESWYQMTGTHIMGPHLKHGAKRDRVGSPANSPDQGSFVSFEPSSTEPLFTADGLEGAVQQLILPNGQSLAVLAVPDQYDANDGDALLSSRAVNALAEVSGVTVKKGLQFVQFLITGDTGLKAMGQTERLVKWPAEYEGYDVLIGRPGLLGLTKRDLTVGKVTMRYASHRSRGLLVLDGFETVPNGLIRRFTPDTMVTYGRRAAIALLYQDQAEATAPQPPSADWFAEEEPPPYGDPSPWERMDKAETDFGAAVRDAYGSVFAHPAALGNRTRNIANRLRSAVRKATTADGEGMPAACLPGAKLKLAHPDFAGVRTPRAGRVNIGWDGEKPYTISMSPKDWASDAHQAASDGDDCDDFHNAVAGSDGQSVNAITIRTPSSPGGGEHWRMSREDEKRWRKFSVILPLREGWDQDPDIWSSGSKFNLGPEIETQGPTQDLNEILAACRWSAGQPQWIGKFANALQALHLSGVPAEDLSTVGSDLIDNVWNQTGDGAIALSQVDQMCIERLRAGKPWFKPAYVRIRKRVEALYADTYDTPAMPVFGHYPEWEELYQGLENTSEIANLIDQTLASRANGPVELLIQPVPDEVALLGADVALGTSNSWKRWGKAKNRVERGKGLNPNDRQNAVERVTARTLEAIQKLVDTAYEKATALPDYVPGDLTTAIRQACILQDARWQRPTNGRPVPTARKLLPKAEYKILACLPREEYVAHYGRASNADPSWMTRLMPKPASETPEAELMIGDEVVVDRTETGEYIVRLAGTDTDVARLREEGYGLVDLAARFIGHVHQYDALAERHADFYHGNPVAVFRTSHAAINGVLKRKASRETDLLKEMSL